MVDAFGRASVGHARTTVQKFLHIEEGGQPVFQESIFDIKTRSAFDFKTRTIKKEKEMATKRVCTSGSVGSCMGHHSRGHIT